LLNGQQSSQFECPIDSDLHKKYFNDNDIHKEIKDAQFVRKHRLKVNLCRTTSL